MKTTKYIVPTHQHTQHQHTYSSAAQTAFLLTTLFQLSKINITGSCSFYLATLLHTPVFLFVCLRWRRDWSVLCPWLIICRAINRFTFSACQVRRRYVNRARIPGTSYQRRRVNFVCNSFDDKIATDGYRVLLTLYFAKGFLRARAVHILCYKISPPQSPINKLSDFIPRITTVSVPLGLATRATSGATAFTT